MGKHRRVDHPKRSRDRQREVDSAISLRLHSEVSPIIDVAFVKLHDELARWPDGWVVDEHGDPDGNNPHVWAPVWEPREVWACRRVRIARWKPFITGTHRTVAAGDHLCTCGMLKSDWEELMSIEQDVNRTWAFYDGLIRRDVQ